MAMPLKKTQSAFANARILHVIADEAAGELTIRAEIDGQTDTKIVYEGMYYSQLDESSNGLLVYDVSVLTLADLKRKQYKQATERLYEDCPLGDAILQAIEKRGNQFFVHHPDNGEFIVMARRLCFGETV